MRALLDTNILIHREAPVVVEQNIGLLFNWLDRLGYEKGVHPVSLEEIEQHEDERVRRSFRAKLESYRLLRVPPSLAPEVQVLGQEMDQSDNDENDTKLVNELYADRIDLLITEDRGLARKATLLGVGDKVFTIDAFLEKVTAENPTLVEYDVLSVKKTFFANVDVNDVFFDSFREDYPGFNSWFNRKNDEPAYVCLEGQNLTAFLYLKLESEREPYYDIVPTFRPRKRLNVGTFKVNLNGYKLGERFLKIVFDNEVRQSVDEIYVTIFPHTIEQERLIKLLEDFGFSHWGKKRNSFGIERVYVRDMIPRFDQSEPRLTFPYISQSARAFVVPIYPDYHTELLPDSILKTESPMNFVEDKPYRNAIQKAYISRSHFRDLSAGDVIVFYRTGGYYRSVVTTLGIVERVHRGISNEEQFIRFCRKRSVFSDDELRKHWHWSSNRPFIVEFLYAYSFPKRPNMATLIENGVISDVNSAPRGFERISSEQLNTILELSESESRFIVN